MRDIKFRVLCERSNTMFFIGLGHTYKDLSDTKIMQYTGLIDKNGKEIYEGDILRYEYAVSAFTVREVKFEDGSFIATRKKYGNEILSDSFVYLSNKDNYEYGFREFEVIGNIYENEDLLK